MHSVDSDWGLYPWFEERGHELIHPDDLDTFRRISPYGKVFERVSSADPYITLRYGDGLFRVKPELFQPVPKPLFSFGDHVFVKLNDRLTRGSISGIQWHHKDAKPFFFLTLGGRALKKRYMADDLSSEK